MTRPISSPIRIGSRGSRLALVQARFIAEAIRAHLPDTEVTIEVIETQGDRVTDRPLAEIGGSGVFIKEIEHALRDGRIDVAVHSMKDMPSVIPDGLIVAATTRRAEPRDALVSRGASDIASLPKGATIGTGSVRRRSQLLSLRPDLEIQELRGNVPTRLEKFDRSSWEAVVLAGAGLQRLDLTDRIRGYVSVDEMVPAVGQGALALEIRRDEERLGARIAFLNHAQTECAVEAERAFLGRLEGGCQVPIGGYAELDGDALHLRGYVGAVDGTRHLRRERRGVPGRAELLGVELAEEMLGAGAADIVAQSARRP